MKKQTTAEIRERERKKILKNLDLKYQLLEKSNQEFKNLYHKYLSKCGDLQHEMAEIKAENEDLKEQVRAYKEWIERLEEFVNMPEEERNDAFKEYIEEKKHSKKLNDLMDVYTTMFNHIFI